MNWELLLPLLITSSVAVAGWFVVHRRTVARDLANKRRELRLTFLIEAYRKLESGASREPLDMTDYVKGFESAIADIQLFGTGEQVRMAKLLAQNIASRRSDASTGPLLLSLRDELREQLNLEVIREEPLHFRIQNASQSHGKAAIKKLG